jgi:hypothetical protein
MLQVIGNEGLRQLGKPSIFDLETCGASQQFARSVADEADDAFRRLSFEAVARQRFIGCDNDVAPRIDECPVEVENDGVNRGQGVPA